MRRLALASWVAAAAGLALSWAQVPAATSPPREQLSELKSLVALRRDAAAESLGAALCAAMEASAHPDTAVLAEAWFQRALPLIRTYRYSDPLLEKATARSLELLAACGCGSESLAWALHHALGVAHQSLGRQDSALAEFRRELASARRAGKDAGPLTSAALLHLGDGFSRTGRPDSAIARLEAGLALRRRLDIPKDRMLGEFHAQLGAARERRGEFDLAEAEYLTGVQETEARLGPRDNALTLPLNYAFTFYFRRGDYARAIDFGRRAYDIRLAYAGPKDVNTNIYRFGLAQAYLQLGDDARALADYEASLPVLESALGATAPAILGGRLSLADACARTGDTTSALRELDRLRGIYERDTLGLDRAPFLSALVNEAMIHRGLGHREEVSRLAERAAEVLPAAGSIDPGDRVMVAELQMNDAADRRDWRRADSLEARLDSALAAIPGGHNLQCESAWASRAEMAAARGHAAAALALARTAARIARERLQQNVLALPDRQALLLAGTLSDPLDHVLTYGAFGTGDAVRAAWDEVVRLRGLVRAEVSRRRAPPGAGADTALAQDYAAWTAAQARLARHEAQSGAGRDSAWLQLRAVEEEAERRLVAAHPGLPLATDPAAVGLDTVLATLRPGEALVGLAQAPDGAGVRHLAAFVGRGGAGAGAVRSLDLGPVDRLVAAVAAWRAQLAGSDPARRSEAACRRAGEAVRRLAWDAVAAATRGATDVFVVPEAPLTGLPWSALPAGSRGYLVEHGPRIHVLDAERERVAPAVADGGRGLLAVGGVDFEHGEAPGPDAGPPVAAVLRSGRPGCVSLDDLRLGPLPGTDEEAREVGAAWDGSAARDEARATLLESAAATEAEFKRLAPGRRVIHLATHGVALEDTCGQAPPNARGVGGVAPVGLAAAPPKGAAAAHGAAHAPPAAPSPWMGRDVLLALAGANHAREHTADENEGLLTAEEVSTLDLRGTEWVVLSACRSAAGASWQREGVLGMQRAFHLAGARTVIASQWSVDDDATREWMRALYEARARGATRAADAMAEASRAVLRARRAAHVSTHPFYWAAFTSSGE